MNLIESIADGFIQQEKMFNSVIHKMRQTPDDYASSFTRYGKNFGENAVNKSTWMLQGVM